MGKKFIVVGAPRTGTTLLVKTLNGVPGFVCHGELLQVNRVRGYEDGFDGAAASEDDRSARDRHLNQLRAADPIAFAEQALAGDADAIGFKIIYTQFLQSRWAEVVQALLDDPGIRFIHLQRRNRLRRYVSERIMQEGGAIHSDIGGRSKHRLRVHVDPDHFLRRAAEIATEARAITAMLPADRVLDLCYETLAGDIGQGVAGIAAFLGIAPVQQSITPGLRKVGAPDLRDAVTNFDELVGHRATRDFIVVG